MSKLFKVSLILNVLFIAAACALWFGRATVLESFLAGSIERQVSLFDQYALAPGDIVFLGDSITQGGAWAEMFPELPIKNRGIGGDTTTGVLSRLYQITDAKPGAVFLNIGTNDLTHGPSLREQSYQQYREILRRIQRESPTTVIYIQSLLPRSVEFQADIIDFNLELEEIASEFNVQHVDIYPRFVGDDGSIEDTFSNDELHLLGSGYKLWHEILVPYLQIYWEQLRSPAGG